MCLLEIQSIPSEEHFQLIRWKAVCRKENGDFAPVCFKQTHDVRGLDIDVLYRCGAIHFEPHDVADFKKYVDAESGGHYQSGVHVFADYRTALCWSVLHGGDCVMPVLISDLVACGVDWVDSLTLVARIVYFLTPEEYEYLITDHKPIIIADEVELAPAEL